MSRFAIILVAGYPFGAMLSSIRLLELVTVRDVMETVCSIFSIYSNVRKGNFARTPILIFQMQR